MRHFPVSFEIFFFSSSGRLSSKNSLYLSHDLLLIERSSSAAPMRKIHNEIHCNIIPYITFFNFDFFIFVAKLISEM